MTEIIFIFTYRVMEFEILKKYMVDEQTSENEEAEDIEWHPLLAPSIKPQCGLWGQIYQMENFEGGFLFHLWGNGPSYGLFLKDNKFYNWCSDKMICKKYWSSPIIENIPPNVKVQIFREYDSLMIRY